MFSLHEVVESNAQCGSRRVHQHFSSPLLLTDSVEIWYNELVERVWFRTRPIQPPFPMAIKPNLTRFLKKQLVIKAFVCNRFRYGKNVMKYS
jgi:hypothetical protein